MIGELAIIHGTLAFQVDHLEGINACRIGDQLRFLFRVASGGLIKSNQEPHVNSMSIKPAD